jgi:futalosine hydrolase
VASYGDILICAATRAELPTDLPSNVMLLECGIGPARTAMELCRFLERAGSGSRPRLVLMTGIAGCYKETGHDFLSAGEAEKIGPLDVVVAEREAFLDLGRCSHNAFSFIEIDGERVAYEFDLSEYASIFVPPSIREALSFKSAGFGTVCCSSASMERAEVIRGLPWVRVENMEGAAAAMVTREYDIPFIEIRAISNYAGEPDRSKWDITGALALLRSAIAALFEHSEAIKALVGGKLAG